MSAAAFDVQDWLSIVRNMFALPDNVRRSLEVPIDRLNQAIGGQNDIDMAIDLGVSLESLLLHGLNEDRGELSFRLSLRGAALLGGDAAARKGTFDLLRNMYKLRSQAVHAGRLRGRVNEEELKAAFAVCARLIRKVIEQGAWPNWQALELAIA
jgi:hypothetical protein